jgi:hypothetical protein
MDDTSYRASRQGSVTAAARQVLRELQANGTRLNCALGYLRRGWSIIPIGPGTKKPPGRLKWGNFQRDQPDEAQLRKWFGANTDHGVAVILGRVSGGLVCRDFDAVESYNQWAAAHTDLARVLPTVATARGRHVYFRAAEVDLRFVDLRKQEPPEEGEYRGDSGHYCVLPPSRHPDGAVYRWLVPLPEGPLPLIENVEAAGFLKSWPCDREDGENRENGVYGDYGGIPRCTEAIIRTDVVENANTLSFSENTPACAVEVAETKIGAAVEADVKQAILDTLPAAAGRRNRQVFEFARALKAIPRLADAAPDDLKTVVRNWHQVALLKQVIGTEPFEETWIDFLKSWPKVKFPRGQEPMTAILEKAKTNPLPPAAGRYDHDGLRLLVAVCRELQHVSGEQEFFLSCRTAGKLLGVDHSTAARYLFLLAHDGIVEAVEKSDRARRRATRYRYRAD